MSENSNYVFIECCTKCDTHSWCTRHDEQKYRSTFEAVKRAILEKNPNLEVVLNQVPAGLTPLKKDNVDNKYYDAASKKCIYFPELGSFEVHFNKVLVFSKHQSQTWPEPEEVANLVCKIRQEKQKTGNLDKFSRFIQNEEHQDLQSEVMIEREGLPSTIERQPNSLAEFQRTANGVTSKKRLFKNKLFRENFKQVEEELKDNSIKQMADLHFDASLAVPKRQLSQPRNTDWSQQDKPKEKEKVLVFNSNFDKQTQKNSSRGKRNPNFVFTLDDRETFYGKSPINKTSPTANLSLTDHFKMYKSQSKKSDLQQDRVSQNFRSIKREINTLSTLNEQKRQQLLNMSIPLKVPELITESKYKNNEILMKLPQFIKRKNTSAMGAGTNVFREEYGEKEMIIRLDNIEEEAPTHLSLNKDNVGAQGKKSGLGIIKEWDKELERLEDRFQKFQQKVQSIKQKKMEFEKQNLVSLQKLKEQEKQFMPVKVKQQKIPTSTKLDPQIERVIGSCGPFLSEIQNLGNLKESRGEKRVVEDYFGIGEEEKNQKLKRIYGKKKNKYYRQTISLQNQNRKSYKAQRGEDGENQPTHKINRISDTPEKKINKLQNNFSGVCEEKPKKSIEKVQNKDPLTETTYSAYNHKNKIGQLKKVDHHFRKTIEDTPLKRSLGPEISKDPYKTQKKQAKKEELLFDKIKTKVKGKEAAIAGQHSESEEQQQVDELLGSPYDVNDMDHIEISSASPERSNNFVDKAKILQNKSNQNFKIQQRKTSTTKSPGFDKKSGSITQKAVRDQQSSNKRSPQKKTFERKKEKTDLVEDSSEHFSQDQQIGAKGAPRTLLKKPTAPKDIGLVKKREESSAKQLKQKKNKPIEKVNRKNFVIQNSTPPRRSEPSPKNSIVGISQKGTANSTHEPVGLKFKQYQQKKHKLANEENTLEEENDENEDNLGIYDEQDDFDQNQNDVQDSQEENQDAQVQKEHQQNHTIQDNQQLCNAKDKLTKNPRQDENKETKYQIKKPSNIVAVKSPKEQNLRPEVTFISQETPKISITQTKQKENPKKLVNREVPNTNKNPITAGDSSMKATITKDLRNNAQLNDKMNTPKANGKNIALRDASKSTNKNLQSTIQKNKIHPSIGNKSEQEKLLPKKQLIKKNINPSALTNSQNNKIKLIGKTKNPRANLDDEKIEKWSNGEKDQEEQLHMNEKDSQNQQQRPQMEQQQNEHNNSKQLSQKEGQQQDDEDYDKQGDQDNQLNNQNSQTEINTEQVKGAEQNVDEKECHPNRGQIKKPSSNSSTKEMTKQTHIPNKQIIQKSDKIKDTNEKKVQNVNQKNMRMQVKPDQTPNSTKPKEQTKTNVISSHNEKKTKVQLQDIQNNTNTQKKQITTQKTGKLAKNDKTKLAQKSKEKRSVSKSKESKNLLIKTNQDSSQKSAIKKNIGSSLSKNKGQENFKSKIMQKQGNLDQPATQTSSEIKKNKERQLSEKGKVDKVESKSNKVDNSTKLKNQSDAIQVNKVSATSEQEDEGSDQINTPEKDSKDHSYVSEKDEQNSKGKFENDQQSQQQEDSNEKNFEKNEITNQQQNEEEKAMHSLSESKPQQPESRSQGQKKRKNPQKDSSQQKKSSLRKEQQIQSLQQRGISKRNKQIKQSNIEKQKRSKQESRLQQKTSQNIQFSAQTVKRSQKQTQTKTGKARQKAQFQNIEDKAVTIEKKGVSNKQQKKVGNGKKIKDKEPNNQPKQISNSEKQKNKREQPSIILDKLKDSEAFGDNNQAQQNNIGINEDQSEQEQNGLVQVNEEEQKELSNKSSQDEDEVKQQTNVEKNSFQQHSQVKNGKSKPTQQIKENREANKKGSLKPKGNEKKVVKADSSIPKQGTNIKESKEKSSEITNKKPKNSLKDQGSNKINRKKDVLDSPVINQAEKNLNSETNNKNTEKKKDSKLAQKQQHRKIKEQNKNKKTASPSKRKQQPKKKLKNTQYQEKESQSVQNQQISPEKSLQKQENQTDGKTSKKNSQQIGQKISENLKESQKISSKNQQSQGKQTKMMKQQKKNSLNDDKKLSKNNSIIENKNIPLITDSNQKENTQKSIDKSRNIEESPNKSELSSSQEQDEASKQLQKNQLSQGESRQKVSQYSQKHETFEETKNKSGSKEQLKSQIMQNQSKQHKGSTLIREKDDEKIELSHQIRQKTTEIKQLPQKLKTDKQKLPQIENQAHQKVPRQTEHKKTAKSTRKQKQNKLKEEVVLNKTEFDVQTQKSDFVKAQQSIKQIKKQNQSATIVSKDKALEQTHRKILQNVSNPGNDTPCQSDEDQINHCQGQNDQKQHSEEKTKGLEQQNRQCKSGDQILKNQNQLKETKTLPSQAIINKLNNDKMDSSQKHTDGHSSKYENSPNKPNNSQEKEDKPKTNRPKTNKKKGDVKVELSKQNQRILESKPGKIQQDDQKIKQDNFKVKQQKNLSPAVQQSTIPGQTSKIPEKLISKSNKREIVTTKPKSKQNKDQDNIVKQQTGIKMVQGVSTNNKTDSKSKAETCEIGVQKEANVDICIQADCQRFSSHVRPTSDNQNSFMGTVSRLTGHSARPQNTDIGFDHDFEPSEQNQRAPILANIYFHSGDQRKRYPVSIEFSSDFKEFHDSEFTAEEAKAGYDSLGWERLPNIYEDITLTEPIDMNCLTISSVKSPHLLEVIKILCHKNEFLITRLFQSNYLNEKGLYGVWICWNSAWRSVVIDDYIPIIKSSKKPAFINCQDGNVWALLLEKAIAKLCGSYKAMNEFSLCQMFKMLTGANFINFRVKQDPSQNQRCLKYIADNEKKNFIITAQRYRNEKTEDKTNENPNVYYILGVQYLSDKKDRVLNIKIQNEQPVWMKLQTFCEQFRFINILQLRQNYRHSHIRLELNPSSYAVVQITVPNVTMGSICLNHFNKVPNQTKCILYRQEDNNLLRLVGQAREKSKVQLFFDCQLQKGRYYLFIDTGKESSQCHLSYFGEQMVRYKIIDYIENATMKNSNNEYIPVADKQNHLNSSSREGAPRLLNNTFDPMTSKYSEGFNDRRSREKQKLEKIRKQFVDYLLNEQRI